MSQVKHVESDGRVFIDLTEADNPCGSCGACCSHFRVSFYMGETIHLGGLVPSEMTSKLTDFHACMKGTEAGSGRCIALVGEVGHQGIKCSIYHDRPSPCREYPVWLDDGSPNPKCQVLRSSIGVRPLEVNKENL